MKALIILAIIFIAVAVAIPISSFLFELWENIKK